MARALLTASREISHFVELNNLRGHINHEAPLEPRCYTRQTGN